MLLPLRASVLRPGQPLLAARWPGDADAEHYVAEAPSGDEIVGVASVFSAPLGADGPNGQLRGMAVDPAARGAGVGLALLRAVEAAHPEGLWCNARVSASGFTRAPAGASSRRSLRSLASGPTSRCAGARTSLNPWASSGAEDLLQRLDDGVGEPAPRRAVVLRHGDEVVHREDRAHARDLEHAPREGVIVARAREVQRLGADLDA
ncbi:MAG: GNAT family N-acetyltransferase [Deltaproteobacteria bacterium]|nr:GNAT family N-acetyltransferase [Deltaproteobacteria bacterium]